MTRLTHQANSRKQLHPRLEQLNRELKAEKTKSFDYINLVGRGFRIRACVMRDEDGRFFASAQSGKAYRVQGPSPSTALTLLKATIMRDANWMRHAEKETFRAAVAGQEVAA